MPTYTAELPVDLDTFRYWFRNMFQASLWGMALETITVFSTKDDEHSKRIATREELYIINRLDVLVAHVHCRAFRADRLFVQAVQFLPYAHLPSERNETFQDDDSGELKVVWTGGDERYILDGLKDWLIFMYGADQVREVSDVVTDAPVAKMAADLKSEKRDWTQPPALPAQGGRHTLLCNYWAFAETVLGRTQDDNLLEEWRQLYEKETGKLVGDLDDPMKSLNEGIRNARQKYAKKLES